MEISIIVICMTAIIITFFVYLLFKDKNARGKIEYDTKTGKLLMQKLSQNVETANINANSEMIEKYKNFKPNECVKKLEIYKDFSKIISDCTLIIYSDIISWIFKNGITSMSDNDYNNYVKEKIKYFRKTYNGGFESSENEFLKNLNLKNILGMYAIILTNDIKQFYNNIYDSHKDFIEEKQKSIKQIKEQADNDVELKLNMLTESVNNYYNQMMYSDSQLLKDCLENFNNVLLGTFHDKLVDFLKEVK